MNSARMLFIERNGIRIVVLQAPLSPANVPVHFIRGLYLFRDE